MDTAFFELLLRFSQEPSAERRAQIERQLWDAYGATVSILVVDMSGFARLTKVHGVVHYLSMVRRMQLTASPIVESYGGKIIKFEADNAYAHFDAPSQAIRASIALNLGLASANLLTPAELDVRVSCGIDHGECLMPHPADCYGQPMNRASNLGEDLGVPGQILVTEEAMALVPVSLGIRTQPLEVELGDAPTQVHSVTFNCVE